MMEQALNINQALIYLKAKKFLVSVVNFEKYYFALRNGFIIVINENVSYPIRESDFLRLFKNANFYLYEKKAPESTIDITKDEQYYQWKK